MKAADKDKAALVDRQERSQAQGSPQRQTDPSRAFWCVLTAQRVAGSFNSEECLRENH